MILRRLTQHIKDQNWFAVALDFFIVVAGILIAFQITNWNEGRAFDKKEAELLVELRAALEADILKAENQRAGYNQIVFSGKRAVNFVESGTSCGNDCWPVLIDFLHASQWVEVDVNQSTYDEMRRLGLPKSREIIDTMEAYLAQNANLTSVVSSQPPYRSHVRGLMPLAVLDAYWVTCYALSEGKETYVPHCPKGVSDEVAAGAVDAIVKDADTKNLLTAWYSDVFLFPDDLTSQNASADKAIAAINAELEKN